MTDIAVAPQRGIKLGLWALVVGLFPVVYAGLGVVFGLLGQGQNGNGVVATSAYVMVLASFVIIPLAMIFAVILGILALVRDRPLGKVLGGIALVLVVALAVAIPLVVGGSNDLAL